MALLISVVVITILVSSQCSLYEAVLYSTRMGTLEAEKTGGKRRAKALKLIAMKREISIPLSAILILNTIANTAGATLAGMYAARALGDSMVPAFSVAFTLGILFFAEIIPKTLGALHWRSLWPAIVWPLTLMKVLLFPFILVTQQFSGFVTQRGATASQVTEEDILGTIRLGAKGGEISQWESRMLHNIINLETKQVREIMTPRTVMFTLDEEMTVEAAVELAGEKGFTRIPVYRGDRENIVGYVMIHDLNSAKTLSRPQTRLGALTKPILFVRETENCLVLMTHFLKKRRHIAVIGDDYGGVAGLVTLEDLIETVLGTEIVDENDSVVDLQKMARNRTQRRFYVEREHRESESAEGEGGPSPVSAEADAQDIDRTSEEMSAEELLAFSPLDSAAAEAAVSPPRGGDGRKAVRAPDSPPEG
jgi:CBS domain containing-hemolysin-like protein